MTVGGVGSLTNLEEVNQSRFQGHSSLLPQLVLPAVTVSDVGNYMCIVKSSFDNAIIFNHTITLTVTPGKNCLLYINCITKS